MFTILHNDSWYRISQFLCCHLFYEEGNGLNWTNVTYLFMSSQWESASKRCVLFESKSLGCRFHGNLVCEVYTGTQADELGGAAWVDGIED